MQALILNDQQSGLDEWTKVGNVAGNGTSSIADLIILIRTLTLQQEFTLPIKAN